MRILAALAVLMIGALVLHTVFVAAAATTSSQAPGTAAVSSAQVEAARALAATLRSYANASAAPCQDFYEHVCGGWLARQDPSRDESTMDDVEARLDAELERIAGEGWPVLQTWYQSCLDGDTRRRRGLSALDGWWAQIDMMRDPATELLPLLGRLHRAGFSAVFSAYVAPDPYNSTARRLWLDWADTLVPYDIATAQNSSDRTDYEAWALQIATLVLGSQTAAEGALGLEAQLVALMAAAGDGYVETQHLHYDAPGFAPHCIVDDRVTPATKGRGTTAFALNEFREGGRACRSWSVAISDMVATQGLVLKSPRSSNHGWWSAQRSGGTGEWTTESERLGLVALGETLIYCFQSRDGDSEDDLSYDVAFFNETLLHKEGRERSASISPDGAARAAYLEALFGAPTTLPFAYAAAGGYVDDAIAAATQHNDGATLRHYLKLRVAAAVLDLLPPVGARRRRQEDGCAAGADRTPATDATGAAIEACGDMAQRLGGHAVRRRPSLLGEFKELVLNETESLLRKKCIAVLGETVCTALWDAYDLLSAKNGLALAAARGDGAVQQSYLERWHNYSAECVANVTVFAYADIVDAVRRCPYRILYQVRTVDTMYRLEYLRVRGADELVDVKIIDVRYTVDTLPPEACLVDPATRVFNTIESACRACGLEHVHVAAPDGSTETLDAILSRQHPPGVFVLPDNSGIAVGQRMTRLRRAWHLLAPAPRNPLSTCVVLDVPMPGAYLTEAEALRHCAKTDLVFGDTSVLVDMPTCLVSDSGAPGTFATVAEALEHCACDDVYVSVAGECEPLGDDRCAEVRHSMKVIRVDDVEFHDARFYFDRPGLAVRYTGPFTIDTPQFSAETVAKSPRNPKNYEGVVVAPTAGECVSSMRQWLAPVLGHYYATEYADLPTRQAAQAMLIYLMNAFQAQLQHTSWMDAPTRAAALRKLLAIAPQISYPDHWARQVPDDAVQPGDLVGSALRILAAQREAELAALAAGTPVDRYAWEMAPYEVNAYYSPTANDIVFPSGIIQTPFFNVSAPLAANYGGLGSVMGHEVGHAFDNQGRRYDWDGNERDWWTPQSAAAFEQRAQCVVRLYDGLPVAPGVAVDGELTLGENWADLTGLRAAYYAWQDARARLPEPVRHAQKELVQRELGLSEEQLFFYSNALHWCSHRVRAEEYELALSDPHAPPRDRVNVPASQSAEFRAAFGCPAPGPADEQCQLQ